MPSFLFVVYTLYNKIDDVFAIAGYADGLIGFFEQSWLITAIAVIAILILAMIVGIGRTYMQYGNYRIASDVGRIYVQKGVFNHKAFSIPKDNIQAVTFKKGFLRRWLGIVRVELINAGGTEDDDEAETATTLFPFIAQKRALQLVPEILPAFPIETEMVKLPRPALYVKLLRPSYFWLITAAVIFYFWPYLWYIPVILFLLIIAARLLDSFHSAYMHHGTYIQLQDGGFSTELLVTTQKKIEELKVKESWLQRKFGLATLAIYARANPIHEATLADFPRDKAMQYYQWYASRSRDGPSAN